MKYIFSQAVGISFIYEFPGEKSIVGLTIKMYLMTTNDGDLSYVTQLANPDRYVQKGIFFLRFDEFSGWKSSLLIGAVILSFECESLNGSLLISELGFYNDINQADDLPTSPRVNYTSSQMKYIDDFSIPSQISPAEPDSPICASEVVGSLPIQLSNSSQSVAIMGGERDAFLIVDTIPNLSCSYFNNIIAESRYLLTFSTGIAATGVLQYDGIDGGNWSERQGQSLFPIDLYSLISVPISITPTDILISHPNIHTRNLLIIPLITIKPNN